MVHRYAPHDYNGDGYSDILWRSDAGNVALWTLRDNQILSNNLPLAPIAADEHIVGTGDFNGDQTDDILFRNTTTGLVHGWLLDTTSGTIALRFDLDAPSPTDWRAVDNGIDFYGSSSPGAIADVLWQNRDSYIYLWDLYSSGVSTAPFIGDRGQIGNPPGGSWTPKVVGDYDGNGHADVLWQDTNGAVAVWLLDTNRQVIADPSVNAPSGSGWHPLLSGDYDADGKDDVLWHNDDGRDLIWFMNGTQTRDTYDLQNPGAQWVPVSSGYYNADDYSDILWHNTQTGGVAIWDIQGKSVIYSQPVGTAAVTLDWHITA